MIEREKIVTTIQQMPEQVSVDELIDRIILLAKIEEGLKQSLEDRVVPDSEIEKRLPEWLS
jgi:hypothetical protein